VKRGLGKGLDALFADNAADASEQGGSPVMLRLTEIEPNREQPRKSFDEEALSQLADSIREHGVLQPLLVRPLPGLGSYQLVAGERRWRAARMAGLSEVPVVIREMEEHEVMEIALIENLQREDLNAIEEAEGYRTLMDAYDLTQDEVSKRVGKSRSAVANAMRLLGLPAGVRETVRRGELSQGHARALLALEDDDAIARLAAEILKKGLSVRAVEKLVHRYKKEEQRQTQTEETPENAQGAAGHGPEEWGGVLALEAERSLTEYLGRKVRVNEGKNKGEILIEYYGDEDLKELLKKIAGE
jgi:ParB family chromosome partitioning protein